ncbi:PHB depolymerase family esterase [Paracoccaceae bacterium Fryx2]|nr:PHB depolymerase family esterase [Paracoccaceae bacterium Fryx2]
MWKLVLVLCFLALPSVAEQQKILLGNRSYLIDLSARPNGSVILALHNAAGNPEEFRQKIRLSGPALAKGYAVIYPEGLGSSWNGLYCCGYAQEKKISDIRFLDLVIADAAKRFGLYSNRVYLTGMGNGSVMAETYAARRAGTVKAVAGVAGTIHLGRTPAARVPLLHIHGLDDLIVPYGLKGPEYGTKHAGDAFTPVPVQIRAFVAANGPLRKTSRMIDARNDGTSVTEDNYLDAKGRTQVRLMTVSGGRHVWPGSDRKGAGNTQEISATAEVLRFFGEHP